MKKLDIGIVHDWFPIVAGAERVVQQMVRAFPNAEAYTLFDSLSDAERRENIGSAPLHTSSLNIWPAVKKYYHYLILQCLRALEEFDLTHHEVILSSSAALAKGAITTPDQVHVS